jgi:hypothetical protein
MVAMDDAATHSKGVNWMFFLCLAALVLFWADVALAIAAYT